MDIEDIRQHELDALPKKERRFNVRLTMTPDDSRVSLLKTDETDYGTEPGELLEIVVTVDPTEFLDYVSPRDIIEAGKEHDLWGFITDDDRAELLGQLGGIDSYEVDGVLDEIGDALDQGRIEEALLALERYRNPKFASLEECKAQYEAAMQGN